VTFGNTSKKSNPTKVALFTTEVQYWPTTCHEPSHLFDELLIWVSYTDKSLYAKLPRAGPLPGAPGVHKAHTNAAVAGLDVLHVMVFALDMARRSRSKGLAESNPLRSASSSDHRSLST
jgi:hypothetical protein